MQNDSTKETADILRFQQNLLRLVTQGPDAYTDNEKVKVKGPVTAHTKQLESWVRKVRAKAS